LEVIMTDSDPAVGLRSVSEIESDLLKAEAAYADANTRLKSAEQERQSALDSINQHQTEFDRAAEELRRRSAPSSKWGAGLHQDGELSLKSEDELSLETEAGAADDTCAMQVQPAVRSVSAQFDRLRFYAGSEGEDADPREGKG
jgi:peptidoglycan hydrolase CwlO-like protein